MKRKQKHGVVARHHATGDWACAHGLVARPDERLVQVLSWLHDAETKQPCEIRKGTVGE